MNPGAIGHYHAHTFVLFENKITWQNNCFQNKFQHKQD